MKTELEKKKRCTEKEHVQFRSLVGQLLWVARNGLVSISAGVNELGGWLAEPTVQHLLDANSLVRRALGMLPGIEALEEPELCSSKRSRWRSRSSAAVTAGSAAVALHTARLVFTPRSRRRV